MTGFGFSIFVFSRLMPPLAPSFIVHDRVFFCHSFWVKNKINQIINNPLHVQVDCLLLMICCDLSWMLTFANSIPLRVGLMHLQKHFYTMRQWKDSDLKDLTFILAVSLLTLISEDTSIRAEVGNMESTRTMFRISFALFLWSFHTILTEFILRSGFWFLWNCEIIWNIMKTCCVEEKRSTQFNLNKTCIQGLLPNLTNLQKCWHLTYIKYLL